MTKSQTLPPDITVTRADVLALPLTRSAVMPDPDRVWRVRVACHGVAHLQWGEFFAGPDGPYVRLLTDVEIAVAERVFFWQTALASDAALADIGNDPAPSAPPALSVPLEIASSITGNITEIVRREVAAALTAEAAKAQRALLERTMGRPPRPSLAGCKLTRSVPTRPSPTSRWPSSARR